MSTNNVGAKVSRGFKRGPAGVSHRVVSLRLLPDELGQLRTDAIKLDMSLSALARQRYLAGLAAETSPTAK